MNDSARAAIAASFGAFGGYALAAFLGYGLVTSFSGNSHDRMVEAAMSAIFVFGPIGCAVGLVGALVLARRRKGKTRGHDEGRG